MTRFLMLEFITKLLKKTKQNKKYLACNDRNQHAVLEKRSIFTIYIISDYRKLKLFIPYFLKITRCDI